MISKNPISAFRLDYVEISPEHQIGRHSQNSWELAYIIRGLGTRHIANSSEPISEGEVVLIPPRIPHCWEFNSDSLDSRGFLRHIAIMFTSRTLVGIMSVFPEMSHAIQQIIRHKNAIKFEGAIRNAIAAKMLAMCPLNPIGRLPLMLELINLISKADSTIPLGVHNILSKRERKLEKLRVFCICNAARQLRLEEVAAFMNMNKTAFCGFIKRNTGLTFTAYINRLRLTKAAESLIHRPYDSISAIAYDHGFSTVPHFNRLFKQRFGVTPGQFRARNR